MLKVDRAAFEQRPDAYLEQARLQPLTIVAEGGAALVLLPAAEYERLQLAEEEYWARCAQEANQFGYLDHDHDLLRRLALAMNARRLGRQPDAPPAPATPAQAD